MVKYTRYRVKPVGRKGHHYLLVKVKPSGKSEGELVEYKKKHKRGELRFEE